MIKRMIIMLVAAAIVFGGAIGWYFFRQNMIAQAMKNQKTPVSTISAVPVKSETWHPFLSTVGTLTAVQNVEITPQVGGIVTKLYFTSGEYVEAGAPLADMDARAQISQLNSDKAKLALAKITYQRQKRLYHTGAVPASDYDQALANMQEGQANVKYDETQISFRRIKAPFAGRVGIRQVSVGQYVTTVSGNTGPTGSPTNAFVNIQTVDPIFIDFTLPQQDLAKLYNNQEVDLKVDTYPNQVFKGKITAINAGVNEDSRMITVRASVANPKHLLYGGMFADVNVLLPTLTNAIVVPETAVTYNIFGNSVFVVTKKGNDMIAEEKFVKVGERRGNEMVITSGLKEGQTIVVAGQIKLFSGAPVKINNEGLPKATAKEITTGADS
tara:strand:- start:34780 stop:35931 length:1152 start_codon:yes stop_codon:yes gene_type:complete